MARYEPEVYGNIPVGIMREADAACVVCEGRKADSARLLHVVDVASVEMLFVQPEENVNVRRHRAYLRVVLIFNPCRLKCLFEIARLGVLLIKLQTKFEIVQKVRLVVVYDLKGLLNKAFREPPAEL